LASRLDPRPRRLSLELQAPRRYHRRLRAHRPPPPGGTRNGAGNSGNVSAAPRIRRSVSAGSGPQRERPPDDRKAEPGPAPPSDGNPFQLAGGYSPVRPAFFRASRIWAGVVPAFSLPGTSATTPGAACARCGVWAASSALTRSLRVALPLSSTIAT